MQLAAAAAAAALPPLPPLSRAQFASTDPYVVLALPRGATCAQVRHRYRELALLVHPDRLLDCTPAGGAGVLPARQPRNGSDFFVAVRRAYETLTATSGVATGRRKAGSE